MSVPAISTTPSVGLSRPGEDVHERRLARPRRAHHRGELAGDDVEGDAAEGIDGGVALAVAAGDVAGGDDGGGGGGHRSAASRVQRGRMTP